MIVALKNAGRSARQVATGLRDLYVLLRWARTVADRRRFVLSSVTLPDF